LLPGRNEKDLHDVPESTRAAMQFVWLSNVDDAMRAALGEAGAPSSGARFGLP